MLFLSICMFFLYSKVIYLFCDIILLNILSHFVCLSILLMFLIHIKYKILNGYVDILFYDLFSHRIIHFFHKHKVEGCI